MKPVVFLGPTLGRDVAESLCDAEFRAPAAMGDITRAACEAPPAIVLIDGVFEDRPSVWHKEILLAMSRGVGVIGASSMGALRAAELDSQGMLGAGGVYDAYATGVLGDDDEVAVVHGPAETGYLPLSDAMVDIRDAVSAAAAAGIFSEDSAGALIRAAKQRHFKQRHAAEVIRSVLPAGEAEPVLRWFSAERHGLKARDAITVLRHLDAFVAIARAKASGAPQFIPTVYLRRLEPFGYRHP